MVPYTPSSSKSSKALVTVGPQPTPASKTVSKAELARHLGKGPWTAERHALEKMLVEEMEALGWLPGEEKWGDFVEASELKA